MIDTSISRVTSEREPRPPWVDLCVLRVWPDVVDGLRSRHRDVPKCGCRKPREGEPSTTSGYRASCIAYRRVVVAVDSALTSADLPRCVP